MTSCSLPIPTCADTLDALAVGAILLSPDERIVMWNRWMEETSAKPRESVLGRSFGEVFPELAEHRVHEAVRDALRYGHPAIISQSLHRSPFCLVRGPQRHRIEQSVQVTAFFSEGTRYCLIQINDVSFALERERVLRRQTMELRESQQRQLALLNGIAEMAWLKDADGRYLAVNQLYAESLGLTPEQVVGRTDFDCYTAEAALRHLAEDREVMASAAAKRTEDLQRTDDGREIWVEKVKVPVIGPTGKVIGTAGSARDITERKQAEEQIQRLNAELEQRVQSRTQELERSNEALVRSNMELQRFAHAAAHDLQTPLRSIAGFAQLIKDDLKNGNGGERANEWLGLVIDNTKRLQTLIKELLSYSRLDAEARPFELIDLGKLVEEAVVSLAAPIGETGAEVSHGPLPSVPADRSQMIQLLQNLIENGIKYCSAKPPKVTVTSERRNGEWVFSVADNGIGIDLRHHKRIFEVFRRLHSHNQIPGTGIGLAICHRIVERHGGRIWVESEPGKGSIFHFSLPDRLEEND